MIFRQDFGQDFLDFFSFYLDSIYLMRKKLIECVTSQVRLPDS